MKGNKTKIFIGIGIVILLVITAYFVFNSEDKNSEEIARGYLEEQGFKVNSIVLTEDLSEVSMDKKGSLDFQVMPNLAWLYRVYPTSKNYKVVIVSDSNTCFYRVNNSVLEIHGNSSEGWFNATQYIEESCF